MKYPCNRVQRPDSVTDTGIGISVTYCANCLPDCPGEDVFDAYDKAEELIQSANQSIDNASLLLRLAARILRQGKEMPENLANYLADAFEVAAYKPAPDRGKMLVRELHLSALNRRPLDVDRRAVAGHFSYCLKEGLTQNEAKLETSEKFGISPSSALNIWKKYKSEQATWPEIDEESEIYRFAISLSASVKSKFGSPKLKRKAKLKR